MTGLTQRDSMGIRQVGVNQNSEPGLLPRSAQFDGIRQVWAGEGGGPSLRGPCSETPGLNIGVPGPCRREPFDVHEESRQKVV